jgi:hypothetical protein
MLLPQLNYSNEDIRTLKKKALHDEAFREGYLAARRIRELMIHSQISTFMSTHDNSSSASDSASDDTELLLPKDASLDACAISSSHDISTPNIAFRGRDVGESRRSLRRNENVIEVLNGWFVKTREISNAEDMKNAREYIRFRVGDDKFDALTRKFFPTTMRLPHCKSNPVLQNMRGCDFMTCAFNYCVAEKGHTELIETENLPEHLKRGILESLQALRIGESDRRMEKKNG